ncbi:MAG TPA: SGNH/GDSL hydrolase family protein [Gemmatimonadales bacterium]
MTRYRSTRAAGTRALGAVAALALLAACENPAEVRMDPADHGDGIFDRYVALGNSITAGYQSGGINDSTQRESYAFLLADQLGTPYAYASLAGRGCAPPVTNLLTQARVGGAGPADCDLRNPASVAPFLNNVAVPGATSFDPFSSSTAASNALTTFILGGRTQVQAARLADPTFVSIWIGNNDVLAAGVSGVLAPMPGVSPGVTPAATFVENYGKMMDELTAGNGDLEGVLIGVVNVTQVPVLIPAAALANPAVKGGLEMATGKSITVLANCTGSSSLISFQLVGQIKTGAHPAVISCTKGQFAPSPLVGELFILDAEEQAAITAAVTAYNAAIKAEADERGWAYFDPNPALGQLRLSGAIPAVPNLANPAKAFGDYISLDGVHPAGPAHVLVANGVIEAINTTYGTNVPAITP